METVSDLDGEYLLYSLHRNYPLSVSLHPTLLEGESPFANGIRVCTMGKSGHQNVALD